MNTCASCKNKTSTDRCPNKAMKGIIFCGKHVRSNRLWKDVNNLDDKVILIQKLWRGYSLRKWINLAGPGVLNRSVCHNDEELVSLDSKKSVNPLDYFAFEENGKVYWFDVRSIAEHSSGQLNPTNPYTRQVLTHETRQRLREICIHRHKHRIPNTHDTEKRQSIAEVITWGWTHVCQILDENGFFETNPMYFISMNRTQLFIFINMIEQDMRALAAEQKGFQTRRWKYVAWLKRLHREYVTGVDHVRFMYLVSKILVSILNDTRDPYPYCFVIMSALHRL